MKLKEVRATFAHRRTVTPTSERTHPRGDCPECHHSIYKHTLDNCGGCESCLCTWVDVQNRCHHDEIIDNACTRCLVLTRLFKMYQDGKNVAHWVKDATHFGSDTKYHVRACDRADVNDSYTVALPIQKLDCEECSRQAHASLRK